MEKDFEYHEVATGLPAERVLDLASAIANLVPLIGGPAANILDGIAGARKEARILEVLQGVSDDLRDFQSHAAEAYVKTEDFADLLEHTLRQAAQERSAEKRVLYRNILTMAITHPGGNYDEQRRFLKTLEDLASDHLVLLRALGREPEPVFGNIGSPMQTLRTRLPEFSEGQIDQLVGELNALRITAMGSLRVMMTSQGAADLRHSITAYGRQFLDYVLAG